MFCINARHWLALSLFPGIGPTLLKKLHARYHQHARENHQERPSGISLRAFAETDLAAAGFPAAIYSALHSVINNELPSALAKRVDAVEAWVSLHPSHHMLCMWCPHYPQLLLEIADPPPLLFVRGQPERLGLPQLGIVGSRKPTADGRRNARRFARELARAGYQITSGLAEGIDAESHSGALEGGGISIAVFGTGLNTVYPKHHRKLAETIGEQGALVSELLPDCGPDAWNFPRRNRIISGMAHGVVVVEAARRSGSLITARLAAEQGREVFVIPGSIQNPMTRGCHHLIRQGAKLIESVDDVLEELPALLAWESARAQPVSGQVPAQNDALLDEQAAKLLQLIAWDPVSLDVLAQQSGMAMPALYAALMTLEMSGRVCKTAGGYVISAA